MRMLSKLGFRVQMDAKSGELENESKTEIFGAPGDAQGGEGKGGHSVLHLKAHLRFNSREHLRLHKMLMVHM